MQPLTIFSIVCFLVCTYLFVVLVNLARLEKNAIHLFIRLHYLVLLSSAAGIVYIILVMLTSECKNSPFLHLLLSYFTYILIPFTCVINAYRTTYFLYLLAANANAKSILSNVDVDPLDPLPIPNSGFIFSHGWLLSHSLYFHSKYFRRAMLFFTIGITFFFVAISLVPSLALRNYKLPSQWMVYDVSCYISSAYMALILFRVGAYFNEKIWYRFELTGICLIQLAIPSLHLVTFFSQSKIPSVVWPMLYCLLSLTIHYIGITFGCFKSQSTVDSTILDRAEDLLEVEIKNQTHLKLIEKQLKQELCLYFLLLYFKLLEFRSLYKSPSLAYLESTNRKISDILRVSDTLCSNDRSSSDSTLTRQSVVSSIKTTSSISRSLSLDSLRLYRAQPENKRKPLSIPFRPRNYNPRSLASIVQSLHLFTYVPSSKNENVEENIHNVDDVSNYRLTGLSVSVEEVDVCIVTNATGARASLPCESICGYSGKKEQVEVSELRKQDKQSLESVYKSRLLAEQIYMQFLDPKTTLYPISPCFSCSPLKYPEVFPHREEIEEIGKSLFSLETGEYVPKKDIFQSIEVWVARILVRMCLLPIRENQNTPI